MYLDANSSEMQELALKVHRIVHSIQHLPVSSILLVGILVVQLLHSLLVPRT